ncbi:T9SS type A sorting domain-containing protein [Flavobacterium sp. CYK-4]|uniref:T9SS-dependent choice-of-anchor J family protein n=1 Tax=Flavobacterium lotistagni TaxID=2709660 RepID=UPI00140C13E4|nr:choice-of-anchor J domain-containing protein [Flavobacterium lotistagni]NHM07586.1 T9SS type A sorting domain-containing protein [Flavobacterium lotistagni]
MKNIILPLLILTSVAINGQILSENFDNINLLQSQGWTTVNASEPIGTGSWFAGQTPYFVAYNGANTSYIAVDFRSTGSIGTISNWLITPTVTLKNGDIISFYSRDHHDDFADRLELRLSQNGANSVLPSASSSALGDFTTLALTINPNLLATGYPTVWTNYTYTITGLSQPTDCRIAFRYYVTNGGANAPNSDYIGIDALRVTSALGVVDFNESDISLTPNPASHTLSIHAKETLKEACVYNMLGKKVSTSPITNNSLNISHLTQGMYIIEIRTEDDKTVVKKFIKE